MAYFDGSYTTAVQNGPRRPSYPFANTQIPDVYPVCYERDMQVAITAYSPQMATRSTPKNWILQSENFGTTWAVGGSDATISTNTAANPNDGATTADSLLEAATTSDHYVAQAFTTFTAVAHTFSCFVKGNSRGWCMLQMYDGTSSRNCYFNISTGAVGTAAGGAVGTITSVGNSWYRCSIVATCAAGSGYVYVYAATADNTSSYSGDTAKGLYLWGAQLEVASSVGAYIPTTTVARTGSAPNLEISEASEGSDPLAFLVDEQPPTVAINLVGQFTRKYARVPGDQVSYPGSIYINLPAVPDTLTTAVGAVYYDSTTYNIKTLGLGSLYRTAAGVFYAWTPSNAFYGPMQQGAGSVTAATGGTFTLTYKTSTTGALNYNDTAATIQTALNGLASVSSDGITFSGSSNNLGTAGTGLLQLIASVGSMKAPVTMTSSLTPTAASTVFSSFNNTSTVCNLYIAARCTITSHGFNGSNPLEVMANSNSYVLQDTNHWSIIDANTIAVDRGVFGSSYQVILAGQSVRAYTPASRLIGTKQTEKFYLPGVTAGITTGADIPRTSGLQTDATLIDAVIGQTGFQTYRSDGPSNWMGPIVSIKNTAINLDDIA